MRSYISDRVSDDKNWTTPICQNLIQQANSTYTNIYNSIFQIALKDEKEDEIYLLVSLLRETLGPFLVRWESVFFTHDRKYKKRVSRKQRDFFQFDFVAIQEVVAGVCANLEQLAEGKKDKKKEKPSKNGGII